MLVGQRAFNRKLNEADELGVVGSVVQQSFLQVVNAKVV